MAQPEMARDLLSIHTIFEACFNTGDLDGLLALYEPEAVLNAQPGAPVRGLPAIREALQGFLALGGKIQIKTLSAYEGPGGIGLTHGEWSLEGGSVALAGKTAEVLRRQADGRWRYVIDNPWA
jgi:ketosteroid isomerase-like protein